MHTSQLVCMVAGVALGSIAAVLSSLWRCSDTEPRRGADHEKAFVLMVKLTFRNIAHKTEFFALWKPLAEHVQEHEPGTLAFELLQLDTEPASLLVYERYIDKDYYLNTHRSSAPMAAFKQRLAAANWSMDITGQGYNELNIGFMQ